MKRLLHIGLLLVALLGLVGQSTAMAMVPTDVPASPAHKATTASMAGMDCEDMSGAPAPDTAPCKNITLQCIAAMGCSPLAVTLPFLEAPEIAVFEPAESATSVVASLDGRSRGPEPDPPAIPI